MGWGRRPGSISKGTVPGRRDSAPPHAPRPGRPSRPPPLVCRPGFEPEKPGARGSAAAGMRGPRGWRARPGRAVGEGRAGWEGRAGRSDGPTRGPRPAARRPARGRAGQARAGGPAGGQGAGGRRNKSAFVERRPPEGHTQWSEPAPPPPPGPPRRPPEPPRRRAPHTYTHALTGLLRGIEGVRDPRTAPRVGSGLRLCWRHRCLRGSRFAAVAAM